MGGRTEVVLRQDVVDAIEILLVAPSECIGSGQAKEAMRSRARADVSTRDAGRRRPWQWLVACAGVRGWVERLLRELIGTA